MNPDDVKRASLYGAFPSTYGLPENRGLLMRDYFATQAMAAMVDGSWPDSRDREEIARRAYLMADAMLAARN